MFLFFELCLFPKINITITTCIYVCILCVCLSVCLLWAFSIYQTPLTLVCWSLSSTCTWRGVLYLLSRLWKHHSFLRWWLLFRGEWPFCTAPFFTGVSSSTSSSDSVSSLSLLSSSTIFCGRTDELWWSFKILAIHKS